MNSTQHATRRRNIRAASGQLAHLYDDIARLDLELATMHTIADESFIASDELTASIAIRTAHALEAEISHLLAEAEIAESVVDDAMRRSMHAMRAALRSEDAVV